MFSFLGLVFATLVGLYIGIAKMDISSGPVWLPSFYISWMGFLVWGWYYYLTVPFEITIRDTSLIEFRSVLKRTIVSAKEIESIRAWGAGMLRIKYKGGKLRLFYQMDGLHDFISTVKSLNPAIDLKGV